MAIIKCPECGTEVSDKAEKCPKCAYPFSIASPQVQTQVIELTSKRYKLQKLLSIFASIIGLIIMAIASDSGYSGTQSLGGLLLFVGIIWYIVIRCKIWWHHK
jgi:uncharacterized membrane protein YvbJ